VVSPGHWVWEGARGRVEVRQLGPQFVTVELVGKVEEDAVPTIQAALERVAPIPGVAMFWDASRLDSFANAFRATCTDYLMANRKTVGAIATLSSSALIAMAISATNLALGGIVSSFRDREKFLDAQRAIAEQQGLALDEPGMTGRP
jgi:predicted DNA-binding ribbon-helix-helix protein